MADESSDPSLDQWSIDVSDDEKYGTNLTRQGKVTKWEPSPTRIAFLYQQLEKNGSLDLKWKCPGRRSPSVHSPAAGNNVLERNKVNVVDANKQSNLLASEFEFDEKFGDFNPTSTVTSVNRRKPVNQGSRKVAKLENVMNNLKKYQIMDSQTKKSSNAINVQSTQSNNLTTSSTTTTTTPPVTSTITSSIASAASITMAESENVILGETEQNIQMDSK